MRADFKIVNSRNIHTIGYDNINKICVISYNHAYGGKTVYYHDVEPGEFGKLMNSTDIYGLVESLFKNKIKS